MSIPVPATPAAPWSVWTRCRSNCWPTHGRRCRHDQARRRAWTNEYECCRTANLFLCCEPLTGQRWVTVTDRRTARNWAQQIRDLVDRRYPAAERIVLVLDDLNTHTPGSLYEAFAPAEAKRLADKLELHYTPKHGSWLNIAAIELSILSRQCLDRRISDKATLQAEVTAWAERRDTAGGSVDWRFTPADARIKLKRFYPTIQE